MSTIPDGSRAGEGRGLVVGSGPPPWYATTPPAPDRSELEDAHNRILAQAVGDHLPCELALRTAAVAAQLQRSA